MTPEAAAPGTFLPAPPADDLDLGEAPRITPPPLESLRRVLDGLRRLS